MDKLKAGAGKAGEYLSGRNSQGQNETSGEEPLSGVKGQGTAASPYDQGNAEEPSQNAQQIASEQSQPGGTQKEAVREPQQPQGESTNVQDQATTVKPGQEGTSSTGAGGGQPSLGDPKEAGGGSVGMGAGQTKEGGDVDHPSQQHAGKTSSLGDPKDVSSTTAGFGAGQEQGSAQQSQYASPQGEASPKDTNPATLGGGAPGRSEVSSGAAATSGAAAGGAAGGQAAESAAPAASQGEASTAAAKGTDATAGQAQPQASQGAEQQAQGSRPSQIQAQDTGESSEFDASKPGAGEKANKMMGKQNQQVEDETQQEVKPKKSGNLVSKMKEKLHIGKH